MARTSASSSAENRSFGGLPPASRSSNFSPMRCISVLGKREKTRTFSGIFFFRLAPASQNEGAEVVARFRPSSFINCFARALVEDRARLDLHARAHRGGDRDALNVGALGTCGLRLRNRIRQGLDVGDELVLGERSLADAGLHDAGLLDAELDRAALGALDGTRDVHGHGADLRV